METLGRNGHRQRCFGPEGFFWDGVASGDSRPSWVVAWAEAGTGLGPRRAGQGVEGDMLQITLSLLAVLGFPRGSTLDTCEILQPAPPTPRSSRTLPPSKILRESK